MKALFLILLLCAQNVFSNEWHGTGLSLSDARELINSESCHESEKHFIGCMLGIESLLTSQQADKLLIPTFLLGSLPGSGELIRNFGLISIVHRVPVSNDGSDRESKEAKILWRDIKYNGLKSIFEQSRKEIDVIPVVDIDKLWRYALQHVSLTSENESTISAGVINAYLKVRYDPHTQIYPKTEIEAAANYTGDIVYGIGIHTIYDPIEGVLIVDEVYENSPASQSGIQRYDHISFIQEDSEGEFESIRQFGDNFTANSKINGELGTIVSLVVKRDRHRRVVSLKRDKVTIGNVRSKLVKQNDRNIVKIKIDSFNPKRTCNDVAASLKSYDEQTDGNINAVVLDLRGNRGGLVNSAVCVGSLFLDQNKVLVSRRKLNGDEVETYLSDDERLKWGLSTNGNFDWLTLNTWFGIDFPITDVPLVILIDSNSASASELLAGALRDHHRALLIGERTFGKGTVLTSYQEWKGNKNIIYYKTEEKFYVASGGSNHAFGLSPDIEVFTTPEVHVENTHVRREADLYASIPPDDSEKINFTPFKGMELVIDCIETDGIAEKHYRHETEKHPLIQSDYQLYTAVDAVNCILKEFY